MRPNKIIIIYFTALCQDLFDTYSDSQIFQDAYASFDPEHVPCPLCHARKLEEHSWYGRWLIGPGQKRRVMIRRFKCAVCHSTHALLPDIITPYRSYSLRFKLEALQAYSRRRGSVEDLCGELGIAISTLYRWIKEFKLHKRLLLDVLADSRASWAEFVRGLRENPALSVLLAGFFARFAFSFWQMHASYSCRRHFFQPFPMGFP